MEIKEQKGFVTEKPDVKQGQYGPYCSFKFATYRTVKNEDGTFGKKPAYWIGLAGKQAAEQLMNAQEGSEIFIASGIIYQEKDNNNVWQNRVKINELYLTGGTVGGNRQQRPAQQRPQQQQMFQSNFQNQQGGPVQSPPNSFQGGNQWQDDSSDLPF